MQKPLPQPLTLNFDASHIQFIHRKANVLPLYYKFYYLLRKADHTIHKNVFVQGDTLTGHCETVKVIPHH